MRLDCRKTLLEKKVANMSVKHLESVSVGSLDIGLRSSSQLMEFQSMRGFDVEEMRDELQNILA